jgi:hypothetical protein
MPALTPAELVNPTTDPQVYPGVPIRTDALLLGNWLYPMSATQGRPVGDYRVQRDGGPLGSGKPATLDDILAQTGATPLGQRYPVVAVGSNAAAGQLANKFGEAWPNTVIPLTATYVSGMGVAHSAHINKSGYMAYAPIRDTVNSSRLMTLWLDAAQLQRINETEPNYHPSTLRGDDNRAILNSREPLSRYVLYRTRWGLYRPSPEAAHLPAGTQEAMFAHLSTLDWFRSLVPEVADGPLATMRALAADANRRAAIGESLTMHGHCASDGLSDITFEPQTYGHGAGATAWTILEGWA